MIQRSFKSLLASEKGFSILEMMLATAILLVGLVAIAQLVPASILLNNNSRTDSSALVFAQRELDQMLDQPLTVNFFTDALGNTCQLGNPASPNTVQGGTITTINNQPVIVFPSPPSSPPPQSLLGGYGFTYMDPTDPSSTTYEVVWAVIITGNGSTASSRRIILGVRQVGGNGFFQPITLDTLVGR
jgi:prepilin-type N-terminal cleavage/methylation domain-containing protein